MRESLGALGLAWQRLLIYPGGLSALLLAWLLARWLAWCAGRAPEPVRPWTVGALLYALPPLAALSLLPLAPARPFPYGLDLMTTLGLLAWPRLCRLALGGELSRERLAGLTPFGLLLVGGVAMAEGAGSLELSALLRAPAAWPGWGLLLAGGLLWLAGVAALWSPPQEAGEVLGDLGLLLVGALPLLAALAEVIAEILPGGWAGWMLPPLAGLLGAVLLGMLIRLRRRFGSRRDHWG